MCEEKYGVLVRKFRYNNDFSTLENALRNKKRVIAIMQLKTTTSEQDLYHAVPLRKFKYWPHTKRFEIWFNFSSPSRPRL